MKIFHAWSLISLMLLALSCEKDTTRKVIYRITDSSSGFNVRYYDESGQLVSEKVVTQSAQDVWNYSFTSDDGGIVFVSANYKDQGSSIKIQILVDGKIYRQAASKNDTISFVTVSGVIPIRE